MPFPQCNFSSPILLNNSSVPCICFRHICVYKDIKHVCMHTHTHTVILKYLYIPITNTPNTNALSLARIDSWSKGVCMHQRGEHTVTMWKAFATTPLFLTYNNLSACCKILSTHFPSAISSLPTLDSNPRQLPSLYLGPIKTASSHILIFLSLDCISSRQAAYTRRPF